MQQNWPHSAISNADPAGDIVILENPLVRKDLDAFLSGELWPALHAHLEQSGYPYTPVDSLKIETKLSYRLQRKAWWMLFNPLSLPICRMTLECGAESWMLRREFFLGLPLDTSFSLVNAILGNSRFAGNPPCMRVDKSDAGDFYRIVFENGTGAGWGLHDRAYVINEAKRATDVHIAMYEVARKDMLTEEGVADFLSIAYEMYESH